MGGNQLQPGEDAVWEEAVEELKRVKPLFDLKWCPMSTFTND